LSSAREQLQGGSMKATQHTLQLKTQQTIAECQRALQTGEVYTCAAALGILLDAEETQVISRQWRSHIDVPAVVAFIQSHTDTLLAEWQIHQRATEDRVRSGASEMGFLLAPVLTWRSQLQTTLRFLAGPYPSLVDVDHFLRLALGNKYDAPAFARARGSKEAISLESALATHWWWYRNTPTDSGSE